MREKEKSNEIIVIADAIMRFLLSLEVLREIIDEHLIMLKALKSFDVLEHFQEDHWIIVVEKRDKNPNPTSEFKISFQNNRFNYLECSM